MELLIFLGSLFFFMCFGVPLAVVLVLCSIVLMYHSGMWDAMIIPNTMLDGTNNYPLMAIPFFVFAGEIMAAGGLSKRVVALAEVMVGRHRGQHHLRRPHGLLSRRSRGSRRPPAPHDAAGGLR